MSDIDELREMLDQTAGEIARVENDPRPWLMWVTYLLEQMERQAMGVDPEHKQAFNDMLAALRDTIKNRLRTGGW